MTRLLPAPSPSGVRVAGDRYQWLVAWQACVTVLHDAATGAANPAISVGVEVDDAGNVDDVVIRRRRPPHSYKQVKYAVDSSTPVNGNYLTALSRTGGPSILHKIARAWRQLTSVGDPVELAIVTNRAPTPPTLLSPAETPARVSSFPEPAKVAPAPRGDRQGQHGPTPRASLKQSCSNCWPSWTSTWPATACT